MKVGGKALRGSFPNMWKSLYGGDLAQLCANAEPPLRSELFSSSQMELHGRALAFSHQLERGRSPDRLLARLGENKKLLLEVYCLLTDDVEADHRVTPAGEWLLDNFHVIEDQIRTAGRHLPKGYSRELPRLANGASAGLPRVYDIALETISHADGRVDPESLGGFVAAYQSETALKLGELWAIPIMLRLALIENLRRVAARIAASRIDRRLAAHWAGQMAKIAAKEPKSLILVIADMARSNPPLSSSFVAELARRLNGHGPTLAMPLTWIEQRLSEASLTIEQQVRMENQRQAADQVSMSNSIGSLRLLGAVDWRKFVESLSVVEKTLTEDPAGVYGKMDFTSRDQYRHVVERLAKRSKHTENEIARKAILLAQDAAARKDGSAREAHVGFHLIDEGLANLERIAKVRLPLAEAIRKICGRLPLPLYAGAILSLTAILAGCLALEAYANGLEGWALMAAVALFLLSSSHLALALANWLATALAAPRQLPRMDFSKGIPQECQTLVAVPSMLTSAQGVEGLVNDLEVRFLANRDRNLHFSLLTDFRDAAEETMPQDEALLNLARRRIEELNAKYQSQEGGSFFLFHRPRVWNPQDRIWMGHERKRGKLSDLNGLLRGRSKESFSLVIGEMAVLSDVKYVIVLDADTQLARDTAYQFAGAMAHPLNRPLYDETRQRVVAGYGILQPRVAASLTGTNRSRYARLFAGETGIDPYTHVVSDVYQDLFGEGSFIGKGIYDVDAFEKALGGRLPENRILSHDLLEGCYARSGLLSDVELYEERPSRYSEDVSRRRRWIRGDWQIARWLLRCVPGPDAQKRGNPLSLPSQWKIFDNLRRSLTPAALTLLLLLGWTVFQTAGFWTLAVVGIVMIPSLLASALNALQRSSDVTRRQHLSTSIHSALQRLAQDLFTLACLPYEAYFSLDSMLRASWRMLVSRKMLLQWNPSCDADREGRADLASSFRAMWTGPALAVATTIALSAARPEALAAALPILGLWITSPILAWWLSLPLVRYRKELTAEQTVFLRKLSRRTWAFFETFVGPDDNWLPPDNYQEHPVASLAHRTSPTNMGLSLLANLSAFDFGAIQAGRLIERTAKALRTMESLRRHQGHFFNWYDTQTLKPLPPLYISSVDSGNLAGHLLTLRPGLLGLAGGKVLGDRLFESLSDTLGIFADAVAAEPKTRVFAKLAGLRQELDLAGASKPASLAASRMRLDHLATDAKLLVAGVKAFDVDPESPLGFWADAFARQCQDALDELAQLAPWAWLSPARDTQGDFPVLDKIPTLNEVAGLDSKLLPEIARRLGAASTAEETAWLGELQRAITIGSQNARDRLKSIKALALQCEGLARMDYSFLFDKTRHLLSIGYNLSECRRDTNYYDLLASEARLACFVAIAQGELQQGSWFALGRLLTSAGGEPILLSWSGSMFEYLMPLLVMPTYESTLLYQTYEAVVARQIEYGRMRGVPWGISESGYNAVDVHLNYQYRAFGVPGLGLKRGLAEDLVVAPYASALALMVAPGEACLNLERLAAEGLETRYGFYEAIDYTPSRLPHGQSSVVVRSFMAHHQGMSLLALAHLLLDRPMQRRFESDPLFQATMLLLQERVPRATSFYAHTTELSELRMPSEAGETPIRVFNTPDTPSPEVQLLSNGRYHVMVTNAGGGYSRWKDIAVTRWREDGASDNWGSFCYLRDVASKNVWSAACQPMLKRTKHYEAIFSEGKAEFNCREHDYDTHMEIAVSSEDDIELRRVRIVNRAKGRRTIDVTSYAEVVLASPASDEMHPAFSNLFVQTEIIRPQQAILCNRRPRSQGERTPWMFHLMTAHGAETGEVSYETDRMKFIGRGNTVANPQAVDGGAGAYLESLSGSEGSVLDPVAAIRCRITLDQGESASIDMVTGVGETREAALNLIGKYQDRHLADRVFDLAWTHGQVLLRQLNATEADAQLYGRLAGSLIYANASLRADPGILMKNRRGQSGLWGYAISGDLPIALLQIEDPANIALVRQLVQAHAYWRMKGLAVDLVIWNEDHAGYRQLLQDQITALIAAGTESNVTDKPGGIFVRSSDRIAEEDRILIQTAARIVIADARGSLADQAGGRSPVESAIPLLAKKHVRHHEPRPAEPKPRNDLAFYNGLGGFTPDGREYVITTAPGMLTPTPWVNVIANPQFGTVVSESGLAYTWSENAHEFRLSPWSGGDAAGDSRGEAFYLRDEEQGDFWSPSPLPCRGAAPYVSRHGFGYSVFEHEENGIRTEQWVYVAIDAAVKFTSIKVRNESERRRSLSVTGYVELALGGLRSKSAMHIITEIDPDSGALFASNPYNMEFRHRTAFFDVDDMTRSISGDRTEFLGRNGTLDAPAAMTRKRLSGRVGAALDPCAAIQVGFDLDAGEEREITFRLGAGRDAGDARNLVNRFRGPFAAHNALDLVWQHWKHTLGAVNVETPDQALNLLANGWLLYQTLSCRLWARSASCQSGGAFGFRDQLQDVMALIYARPGIVREQLLLCASRQFAEGDVQHWWHPPEGQGVRTRCSDDFLWMPLAACRYVAATGDTGVLDEPIRFIQGRPLKAEEDSCYDLPGRSEESATLYGHCVKAILNGLKFGDHGLPLIGSGDWNDGMNLVGGHGKGESVWLAFLLYETLMRFSKLAGLRGDDAFVERCVKEAAKLQVNIEANGWDGNWYLRAYFDDGSPLGASVCPECKIDSIAQSWSVLSGAGDRERSRTAMDALDKRLVNREHRLIKLLAPPFDKSALEPGYIKGYLPGVRENGGQYTHAAIWAAMAFARLGDKRRAWELFAMINPVNHARSPEETAIYKAEPYAIAADVYSAEPHAGRGGWTWYTGSAAWMYRLIMESLLGLSIEVDRLRFAPCLPPDWKEFKIHYRYQETVYHISVMQDAEGDAEMRVSADGVVQDDRSIPLADDHSEHWCEVHLPSYIKTHEGNLNESQ